MRTFYTDHIDGQAAELGIELIEAQRQESADQLETSLAITLQNATNKDHPEYDPEFDKEIRALRPDWFKDENLQTIH